MRPRRFAHAKSDNLAKSLEALSQSYEGFARQCRKHCSHQSTWSNLPDCGNRERVQEANFRRGLVLVNSMLEPLAELRR